MWHLHSQKHNHNLTERSQGQLDKCQEDDFIFWDALALKANDSCHGIQNRPGGIDHISLRCASGERTDDPSTDVIAEAPGTAQLSRSPCAWLLMGWTHSLPLCSLELWSRLSSDFQMGFGPKSPEFRRYPCRPFYKWGCRRLERLGDMLTLWLWANLLASSILSFFICKMGELSLFRALRVPSETACLTSLL